jgi:hypothetical protein
MSHPRLRIILTLLITASYLLLPPAQPAPAQSQGDFVTVQGSQLIFRGKPIKLKGTNFYPKDGAWANMWERWDGPATLQDLARSRELGLNTVRILVPYKPVNGWTDKDTGAVYPEYLEELRQFVQMAADMDMKVIVALFDFYDPSEDKAVAGSAAEARDKRYLQDIVPVFANDDRVLAWDLHNEPDQYTTWRDDEDPAALIEWLDRMAAEVRRLDHNHLVTVGMSLFDNLFVADKSGAPTLEEKPRGRTVADISDFISFHSYNAGNMDWQIKYIKGHTTRPIVLQETGWPTGPPCQQPDYSERQQVLLYDLMVKAATAGDIAGLLQWQLWDFKPGSSAGGGRETHEDYFGLLRRDGTWKAAMPLLRDGWPGSQSSAAASPLPSLTKTNLAYTVQPKRPPPSGPDYQPPLYFPETGHYIYATFRDYWRRFGGLEVFGYPITEQRKEGGLWVQYFERARFEDHPEVVRKIKDWDKLDKPTKLKFTVQLTRLGADLVSSRTAGKGYSPADPAALPPGATLFPETGHSISGKIAEYWWANSGITNFGYPLSEPLQEVSQADGKTYTVQYFERTRLELHPENAGTRYEILLGLMGREAMAAKGCK